MKIRNEDGSVITVTRQDNKCPACNEVLNATSGLSDAAATPNPGDFSLCAYCGTVLRFNDDLSIREAEHADIEILDDELFEEIAVTQMLIRSRKKFMDNL